MTEQNPSPRKKIKIVWLIVILVVLIGCLVIAATGLAVLVFGVTPFWKTIHNPATETPVTPEAVVTQEQLPTATEQAVTEPTAEPTEAVSLAGAQETFQTLADEIVPINNPIDLGERLGGKTDIPVTVPDNKAPYAIGAVKDFWVTNVDTNENFKITATLRYLGDNLYIWIQNGVDYNEGDLKDLGDTFDKEIYPIDREFFGSEWKPGIDDDPHIYMVYAGDLGFSLAGYFSSADELSPEAHEYSNAHEMFLINSDNVQLWESYIYGTLAHEFQHMIHWYTDKNEETWLNEGFSMLAELINNFDPGGFDYSYIANPDLQLTDWGGSVGSNGPHYGAAFLFTTYLLDRFGEDVTKAIVANPANGMESIDLVMQELNVTDPQTGKVITGKDIFADWVVANLLGDASVGDGRYAYGIYPSAPTAEPDPVITNCPTLPLDYGVSQFGVDYLQVDCAGDWTLDFTGKMEVSIIPTDAYSGKYFFWSNMGDESDMSLERSFDLTGVEAPVEMTYQTWYDLEEDYDYVFVSATTDGENWQILNSTSCTSEDPSGNSYGCGLNGKSDGWQMETVDLSEYAGQTVTVRFDYVTDAAVNGIGMAIDDIRVDAINYFTDLESDDGGWKADGFVRIENSLPQTYRLSLVTYGDEITVTPLVLDENNHVSVSFSLGGDVNKVVLAISGTTDFTRQRAKYHIEVNPQ